jgi:hypothetical protein
MENFLKWDPKKDSTGNGTITMEEAIIDAPSRFRHMALSQD